MQRVRPTTRASRRLRDRGQTVTPPTYPLTMSMETGSASLTGAWTNDSVRALVGDADPLEFIVRRCRDIVFEAVEAGWSGPPFDPLALAKLLGLPTLANDDLRDARVAAGTDGRPLIEFNPTRPRGRLKYSIAHEIGHTFFPDVLNQPRHRTGSGAVATVDDDAWQLELLCNIIAAELVMPVAFFPVNELENAPLDIDRVMVLRARFDVSAEAVLRRVAEVTSHPIAVFAAARLPARSSAAQFRIDYVVPSRTCSVPLKRGNLVDSATLAECSAVGFTAKAEESWPGDLQDLVVQAVGIPAYPGDRLPRVAGFVSRKGASSEGAANRIQYVTGDATKPRGRGPNLIAHVVNDVAHAWGGAGFARQLGRRYPHAAEAYKMWTIARPDNLRLGNCHTVDVDDVTISSMVAQAGYGASESPRLRYSALNDALGQVAHEARRRTAAVHMPRIGLGQGGGLWDLVADAIDASLCRRGVAVTVYTRPAEHSDVVWSSAGTT